MPEGRRFLNKKNIAARLNVHPATVDRLVRDNRFPRPIKLSERGACRWAEDVVTAWEDARIADVARFAPTSTVTVVAA